MKSRCIKKSQETFKKINFNVLLFYIVFDVHYDFLCRDLKAIFFTKELTSRSNTL